MDGPDSAVARLAQGESWPPTQLHLGSTMEHDGGQKRGAHVEALDLSMDLSRIDDDPLAYFLATKAPSASEGEGDKRRYAEKHYFGRRTRDRDADAHADAHADADADFDFQMDFDAGIEDTNHPPPIIRSVSPSALDGLLRLRPPTPPKSRAMRPRSHATDGGHLQLIPTPDTDDDDDHDSDSILSSGEVSDEGGTACMARRHLGLPFQRLRSLAAGRTVQFRGDGRESSSIGNGTADALLSPSSFHVGGSSSNRSEDSSCGQAALRSRPAVSCGAGAAAGAGRLGTWSGFLRAAATADASSSLSPSGRRSPRSWRQPSLGVWSIEEEDENQVQTDEDMASSGAERWESGASQTQAMNIPVAKASKRVRFVLPAKDGARGSE